MVNPCTHRSISPPPNPHTSSFTLRHGKPPHTSINKSSSKSRKALLHEFLEAFGDDPEEAPEATADDIPLSAELDPDPPADLLINATKGSSPNQLPPGDICRVMSKNSKRFIQTACIEYKVSYHKKNTMVYPLPALLETMLGLYSKPTAPLILRALIIIVVLTLILVL
jgi:hypothetical protein